jgi:hypothetical protein
MCRDFVGHRPRSKITKALDKFRPRRLGFIRKSGGNLVKREIRTKSGQSPKTKGV